MPKKELKDIEVGDRVWVSTRFSGRDLETVLHLTPTQIHLDGYKAKFNRGTIPRWSKDPSYRRMGSLGGEITAIATPEECAEWDANLERQRLATEDRKQQAANAESKRDELTALFPVSKDENRGVSVSQAEHGNREDRAGRYKVSFHNLTEQEVRGLSLLVKDLNF